MGMQKGHSGGPIIFDGLMIGIHIASIDLKQLNYGKIFDAKMINSLSIWTYEMKGMPIKIDEIY